MCIKMPLLSADMHSFEHPKLSLLNWLHCATWHRCIKPINDDQHSRGLCLVCIVHVIRGSLVHHAHLVITFHR